MLASIRNVISDADIEKVICSVGLDPKDDRKYKKYSLGMKQRLGIAAAIMESPDLLVLDEPLNALDAEGVDSVHKLIIGLRSKNRIIPHRMP